MARVTYQASANNKPWSPNLTPDTSDRILKQSEDYIQKLKAARDFQAAQDAQFITEYTASIDRGIASQRQVDLEQERQARALASYKQAQLRDQAARAKSIGGSVTGGDQQTNKWLNFVLETSQAAAQVYGTIKEQHEEQDKQYVAEIRARYPTTFQKIGEDIQLGGSRIAGQRIEAAAAQAELNGDLEQAETLRSLNAGQTAEMTRLSMIDAGRQMPTDFERDRFSQTSVMDVVIDGETRPLNTIRSAKDMRQAYPQYRNAWMKANGFSDIDNRLYTDGLAESQKGFEKLIGSTRQNELQASKANRLDQARTAFRIKFTNPDTAQAAVQDFFMSVFNHNGGNRADARAQLLKEAQAANLPEESVQALVRTVLPGMDKPIGTYVDADGNTVTGLYDQDVATLRQQRLRNAQNIQNEYNVQQSIEFEKSARLAQEAYLEDYKEDGTINEIDEYQLKARIEELTRLGPAAKAELDVHKRWAPSLSSAQNDKRLNDEFQFYSEQGTLRDDDILNSSASTALKRKWLKANASRAAESLSEDDVKQFTGIARAMLMERTKETPGSTGGSNSSHTKRAVSRAVKDFQSDYMLALRDGKSRSEAYEYAEGRFNDRFKDSENGLYAVTSYTQDVDGVIKPGVLKKFGPKASPEITEPLLHLDKQLQEHGRNILNVPGVVADEVLERIDKDVKNNRRMTVIPQPILILSQSLKRPVIDVTNTLLKNSGRDPIPPVITEVVKQAEVNISPEWQKFFSSRPGKTSFESADAAMIGSGQDPIYAQSSPTQERIKAIFSSRESPNAGYDAINRGQGGDTPGGATARYGRPLTQMTLGEVKQLQAQELNAVGKYQFIETTLREAAADAGITDDMLFNEAVQDRIFFVHLDKYGAYGPWERWWIQQGGQHLALTPQEKQVIASFRNSYDPSKPWRQAKNLNPAVIPAIPVNEEDVEEVTGFFTFDKDGNKIPAN